MKTNPDINLNLTKFILNIENIEDLEHESKKASFKMNTNEKIEIITIFKNNFEYFLNNFIQPYLIKYCQEIKN